MNLLYLLLWVQQSIGSYHKGNYLFTETVKGTCDFTRKSQYIYDYKDLGGSKLDEALSIGFGFWLFFDTSKQELLYNVSNLFFLSDNDNSFNFRIISFGLKKYGINSTLELFQQDQILKQGPSININTQDLMDDKWQFVYVSYDFLFLKYSLGVFEADKTVIINGTYSCPSQLKYCTNETLPQPFLKREKLKLYIAQNGPYRNDTMKSRSWCGSVSGFQYYLDVLMVSDYNLDALMYGYDKSGIYLNYPLTQMSGNQLYDYSGQELDIQHDITVDWTDQAFTIGQPISINLPLKRFLYNRFFISFWLKVDAGINFAILQRMVDSVIMFELDITYYAIGNYYFFTVIRENFNSQIDVQFNVNQWNHFVLIFNYDKISYEDGIQTKAKIYKNNEDPQYFDLTVPIYNAAQDSDVLTFGKRDSIASGKTLKIVNLQFHQGARVYSHKSKEAGDNTCLLSAPKVFQYNCLLCSDGYFLFQNKCITSSDCTNQNGLADADKKICLPQCDFKCKTCNILTPTICTLCINNLQLNSGVCSCPNNGYIGNGLQLKCKEFNEVQFTEIGTYQAILNYVKSGINQRKDELQIFFKQTFSSIPSVIVAIKEIKITKGNSFKLLATQVTQETFVLSVEAFDQTTIENLAINYFATLQSDLFVLMQEEYDTTNSFAIGSGNRLHQVQILLNEWNIKLHYPKVIPYFNGMQFVSGTNNVTVSQSYSVDNINKYILVDFQIKGDIQISKIYYSFILISEEFETLISQFNSQSHVLWITQPGAQKQNTTMYSFKNPQINHFYGISVLGYVNSEIKNIAVHSELNSQINQYNLFAITDDDTIIDFLQIQIIGIGINCQTYGCSQCKSSPVDCLICKDNSLLPAQQCLNCAINQYLDSEYSCQPCKWNCQTCEDADQCLTCPINVNRYDDPINKCPCQNGYYDNGVALCVQCDWRCETCEQSATKCTQCKGANRNSDKSCLCNDQFYEVGTDLICKNCQEPCDQCDVLGCITCLGNRVINGIKQCVCPTDGIAIAKSQYCETCDTAEVLVTLNETTESLSVFFVKENTTFVTLDYSSYAPQDLCIKIIDSTQLSRFGLGPKCYYNGTNINIEFGIQSQINLMEEIQLIEKVFVKASCKIPIKKYVLNMLQFPTIEIYSPQFTIDGPLFPVFICKSVTLSVSNIKYAGKRQLSKIDWKLIESDANQTVIDSINVVLKEANQNNLDTITFNSKQFQNFTNYTFEATGLSFATKIGSQSFKLQTLGLVQPIIQADITHFNHYYKQSLIIPVTVSYQICQSTKIVEESNNLTLFWIQLESNPVENKPLIEDQISESILNKQHYFKMQPKEGYPDTSYIIQAQLMYQDIIEIFEEQIPEEQVDEGTTNTDEGTTNTDEGTTNTDEGTTNTDEGTTNTDEGTTNTDEGTTNTDEGTTNTDEGTTNTDEGTTNTDEGTTNTDEGTTNTDEGTTNTDEGTTNTDEGTTNTDEGTTNTDEGTTNTDEGTTNTDEGTTNTDEGTTNTDEGTTNTDEGTTNTDEGTTNTDEGTTNTDEGTTNTDEGTTNTDEGTTNTDEGTTNTDEGTTNTDEGTTNTDEGTTNTDEGTTNTDEGTTNTDEGTTNTDEGTTNTDEGTTNTDEGTTNTDEGTTNTDEGTTNTDEGTTNTDEGTTNTDEGTTNTDEGTTNTDEGTTNTDEGTTNTDEGTTNTDEGTTNTDEGNTNTDEGNTNTDEGTDEGTLGEEEEEEEVIHFYKQINIFTYLNFTIDIDYVGVSVIILGGDRFISEGQSLTLEAQYWDGIDEGSSYNSDSSIGLLWECIQVATNKSCQLNDGSDVVFEENVTSISLEGEIFKIGQQYQVSVTAYKDLIRRYYKYVSNVICSFKSVEELIAEFPIVAQTKNIDIQQPITFTFIPNYNLIAYYNYTIIVLYDNYEISKQTLNYPQKTLKLIDYLPSTLSVQTCTIQIIQQSQTFYQMAILPIMFNLPPQNAQITISTSNGVAIETIYNIVIEGAEDQDLPLQYRLSLYTSQSNFLQDLMQSSHLNQIILTDYQFSNTFSCRLPSGFDSNLNTTSYIVLMAQIKDSRGAVSNVTMIIGNSPQFKLWKAYLISVNDFKTSVTQHSNKTDVIASSLELLSFYFDFQKNNFNCADLAPTMKILYAKLKSQVINDLDAIYSRNKILSFYDQTMFQMYLLNETEKSNLIQTKLQSILDTSFQFKTKLLAALALSQQREYYGDLTSLIDIDYFQFILIEQLKQFNSVLSQKLNIKQIEQTYNLLSNTTLQKWRLNHTELALEMDTKEEEEKANGTTINYQLIKYNTVIKFIQPFTVDEIFGFSNINLSETLTNFRNQFNFTSTQLTAITDSLQKFCKINESPLEFNTTFVSIKLQLLTYDYFKSQYNFNENKRLLTQLNSTYKYLIVVHKYTINPYMIDEDFFNFTGTFAFDQTFPLYQPLIYEISNNTVQNVLEEIDLNEFTVDFIVPNSSLSILNQYQCAQKKTKWRSDDSNCTRKVEYLTKIFQFKIWCICPYFSETTLIRPFYVEEIALLKPKLFSYDNFMDYTFGLYCIGLTGGLLLLSILGVLMDKSNADKIKLEEEEMEKERIQIIFSYRVKKRRAQQEEDSKTFLSESKTFSNTYTQTESQPINSNSDIGIQELSCKFIFIGIFKLEELISVFLYYDDYVLRPIRFLAIYLKLIVMLSVSGVLLSEVNIIQQYGIIILVSEISALVVKIVKAIFSGKLIQIITGAIATLCILALSFYSIVDRAFGKEQEYLDNWMQFYAICIGIYFIILDPIQSILKMFLYPWCRKQIETQQETPILHLLYFLITQNDLRTYFKVITEKQLVEDQENLEVEKDQFQEKKEENLQEI
ncbi:unnamed protein product [Paramecium sonneborni]|uniref:H-type lectin domain-containing protein n=1 Tax=Paramecium sonneborni TaxID=65129 RepID=A0A8S1LL21_9CILI|nr:unnamed protein product [Paramecium sonneborni]